MVEDDEDYSEHPEFSDALRKLGWLSSYCRQVILTRHMLRTLQDGDVLEEMLWRGSDQTVLGWLRLAITVYSDQNKETKIFSAPYEPLDKPDTYHLAYFRKRRIFTQSEMSGLSSFEFHTSEGGGFGFDNSSTNASEDDRLIEEVNFVYQGVTNSTKAIGDERAKQLLLRGLWTESRVYDWLNYEKFFNEWRPKALRATDFWRRWMRSAYEGVLMDNKLQFEVANIDESIWQEGIEAVAAEIEKIEARLKTSVATPLVRNDADDAFVLDDEQQLETELLDYLKERVGGALSTALKASGNNGFDEECEEALAIARALESANPSAVAGLLNDASLMFQTNLGNRYPEDGALIALQTAAFSAAEEICETDEIARKRCLRASKLYRRENPEAIDPEELKELTEALAAETKGEARAIIEEDSKAIASGQRVGNFIRARFANYSATIVLWIDKAKKSVARVEWLWKMVRKLMDYFTDTPPQV